MIPSAQKERMLLSYFFQRHMLPRMPLFPQLFLLLPCKAYASPVFILSSHNACTFEYTAHSSFCNNAVLHVDPFYLRLSIFQ